MLSWVVLYLLGSIEKHPEGSLSGALITRNEPLGRGYCTRECAIRQAALLTARLKNNFTFGWNLQADILKKVK
jgi:hypothetical protein